MARRDHRFGALDKKPGYAADVMDTTTRDFAWVISNVKVGGKAIGDLGGRVVADDLAALHRPGVELPAVRIAPDDPATIGYTSGTTGDPKGVILSHADLLANIRAMGAAVGGRADDRFVSWLPLYHDMGLIGAWNGSLTYGFKFPVMSPLTFLAWSASTGG